MFLSTDPPVEPVSPAPRRTRGRARLRAVLGGATALALCAYVVPASSGPAFAAEGPRATGGDVFSDGRYVVHRFLEDGTFTVTDGPLGVEYLVVGGGGGGGACLNGPTGGGGAGGALWTHAPGGSTVTVAQGSEATVTVGAGGEGATRTATASSGGTSIVTFAGGPVIDALGGGGGGGGGGENQLGSGHPGASGGGGTAMLGGSPGGAAAQGHPGGDGGWGQHSGGGGGGGAGGPGGAGVREGDGYPSNEGPAGDGGPGLDVGGFLRGFGPTQVAGGGGGANTSTQAAGVGRAGGGAGRQGVGDGWPAEPGSGSGGGGGFGSCSVRDERTGGAGGSGAVYLRYPLSSPTAPVVVTHPEDQEPVAGDTVELSAAFDHALQDAIFWETSPGESEPWTAVAGVTGPTLTVQPAYADSGARYRAGVTNAVGTTRTEPAVLDIQGRPPTAVGHPAGYGVAVGSHTTFLAQFDADPGADVRWQRSTDDGATWAEVDGGVTTTDPSGTHTGRFRLDPVTEADAGHQYRAVMDNGFGSATTNSGTLSIITAPSASVAPTTPSTTAGRDVTLTAAVDGNPSPALLWQSSTDGGTWTDVAGASSATLTLPGRSHAQHGTQYRVRVDNLLGTGYSDPVTLQVLPRAPVITLQPVGQTVTAGQAVSFTVGSDADPTASVQWERSVDGGVTWIAVDGADQTTLMLPAVPHARDGWQFRARAHNVGGEVFSAPAVLSVIPTAPSVAISPAAPSLTAGGSTTLTAVATGDPAPSLLWQTSTDGSSWTDVVGAVGATLTLDDLPYAHDGTRYRVRAANVAGAAYSTPVVVEVLPRAPVITAEPGDVTVVAGQDATFTVGVDADPVAGVQWQRSTDDGSSWTDLVGQTASTLVVPSVSYDDGGTRYRTVADNGSGSVTSTGAVLTVTASAPSATVFPPSPSTTAGGGLTLSVAVGGDPTPTVQWQTSPDGGTWTSIAGATGPTLTLSHLPYSHDGTHYRAQVTNEAGTVDSTPVTVQVLPRLSVVSITPSSTTVTAGSDATLVANIDGDPVPAVQWQSSDDGVRWKDLPGATSTTLTLNDVAYAQDGTRYRARATNRAGTVGSTPVTLTVEPTQPSVVVHPQDLALVVGQAATWTVTVSGDPYPSLQWQRSDDDGITWADIPEATTSALRWTLVTGAEDGTRYRVVATSVGGTATSEAARLSVGPQVHRVGRDLLGNVPRPTSGAVALVDGAARPVTVSTQGDELLLTGAGISLVVRTATATDTAIPPLAAGGVLLERGGYVVVTGEGFAPGTEIALWIFSEPRLVLTGAVDPTGAFWLRAPVPHDLEIGPHTLQMTGLATDGTERSMSVSAELQHPAVPYTLSSGTAGGGSPHHITTGAPGQLPSTGHEPAPFVLTVGWLLLGGAALLLTRRRWQTRDQVRS